MKKITKLFSLLFISGVIIFAGCKKDDEPDPEQTEAQKQFDKLNGVTWVPTSVNLDGDDVTSEFSGFELSFDGTLTDNNENVSGTYSTSNGGEIWPTSGSWEFGSNISSEIIRGDGLNITYTVGDNALTLEFTYTTDDSGSGSRTKAIDGDYVFELEPTSSSN